MLPSPITVTIAGTAHSLNRINQDNFGSVYLKKGDGFEVRLSVRHQYERTQTNGIQVERHNVDLQYTLFAASPELPAKTFQTYLVMRAPRGTDVTQLDSVVKALNVLTTAQAAAIIGWAS